MKHPVINHLLTANEQPELIDVYNKLISIATLKELLSESEMEKNQSVDRYIKDTSLAIIQSCIYGHNFNYIYNVVKAMIIIDEKNFYEISNLMRHSTPLSKSHISFFLAVTVACLQSVSKVAWNKNPEEITYIEHFLNTLSLLSTHDYAILNNFNQLIDDRIKSLISTAIKNFVRTKIGSNAEQKMIHDEIETFLCDLAKETSPKKENHERINKFGELILKEFVFSFIAENDLQTNLKLLRLNFDFEKNFKA